MRNTDRKDDVIIRRLAEEDLPFAAEVQRAASWNQVRDDWISYLEYDPNGCFLAEVQGEKAGTATTIGYDDRFGWVGMVLVHPSKRRLGVGTALLRKCIQYLQDSGIACVKLDATPMGRKVYVTMGFCNEYQLNRYEGIAQLRKLTINHDYEAVLFSECQIGEIIDFDRQFFGASRPQVISRLYNRGQDLCYFIQDRNGIAGYIMARDGSNAYHVGPWVAKDLETAEILLQSVFEKIQGQKVFLDVPCPNEQACRLIESYSYTVQRPFMRMYLGPNDHPDVPEGIFATSGAEKG